MRTLVIICRDGLRMEMPLPDDYDLGSVLINASLTNMLQIGQLYLRWQCVQAVLWKEGAEIAISHPENMGRPN